MHRLPVLAFVLLSALAPVFAACSGDVSSSLNATCTPGSVNVCVCASGAPGTEVCAADGTFLPCICTGDDGGSDGGSDHDAETKRDTGAQHDAGADSTVPPTCMPNDPLACEGKCGQLDNQCGTVIECGDCAAGETCGGAGVANVCGTATCAPSCAGSACGASDGCGGVCTDGTCASGQSCSDGVCVCGPTSCAGCCAGSSCEDGTEDDACGQGGTACDTCTTPSACTQGTCTCTPSCDGVSCGGDDGCGGTCDQGTCPSGEACVDDACSCSPASCPSGCCDGVTCKAGDKAAACGTGGNDCVTCSASTGGTTCTDGVCGGSSASCTSPEVTCGDACCAEYGYPTSLGGTGSYPTGSICVRPVTITTAGTLVDIGIIGVSTGVNVSMALYTDNDGVPDALVAQTSVAALTDGTLVLPTPSTAVAAASYWIGAEFSGAATVEEDPSTTVTSFCSTTTNFTFTATLPASFPAGTSYSGRLANWYVLVE